MSCCTFFIFLARRSSAVSFRAWFLSSWAFCRAAICLRTCLSILVGSWVASAPRTFMRLEILTLASGAGARPRRTSSCFCNSRSMRLRRRSFFRSFLVRNIGMAAGVFSLGGSNGIGCSTKLVTFSFFRSITGCPAVSYEMSVYVPFGSTVWSHHSTSGTGSSSRLINACSGLRPSAAKLGLVAESNTENPCRPTSLVDLPCDAMYSYSAALARISSPFMM
mmetsp:Transcript_73099/g.171806  ORF Transcript_73099/g.171806 Transcript_73099/m.171806 type:complete len:221 (-) Transcript_73099:655-1317(-)